MNILSKTPLLIEFNSSLSPDLIQSMLSVGQYSKSTGWVFETQSVELVPERTSSSFVESTPRFDNVIKFLLSEVKNHTGHQYSFIQTEHLHFTKYGVGEFYKPHWDSFNLPGQKPIINDRVATIILYLNDDFVGGGTTFPNLNCTVKPVTGKVVYFSYPSGIDPETLNLLLHGGDSVESGEKKIVTLWITEKAARQV